MIKVKGFEKGGGVNGFKNSDSQEGPAQYFASIMFYNRTWFGDSTPFIKCTIFCRTWRSDLTNRIFNHSP